MTDLPILQSFTEWACPNCDQTDVTTEARPHTRMHTCPGLKMLTAPFVPAGSVFDSVSNPGGCQVIAHEREDYVGNEHVTYNADGRPIMAVETQRADGSNDLSVFAPCALAFGNGGSKS